MLALSVRGHDHHMNNIKEGEAVSDDPIVSYNPVRAELESLVLIPRPLGFDIMGAHFDSDICVGDSLPLGDGAWGMYKFWICRVCLIGF